MITIKELQQHFPARSFICSISVRPARIMPVELRNEVNAIANRGLEGDRYKGSGSRQVTLIATEDIAAVSSIMGRQVSPEMVRRNLVTQGINLLSLKGMRFRVGEAVLEFSGECHPCSRMEEALGFGGYNAMRGRGGITAKIISDGKIRLGDAIEVIAKHEN